MRRTEVPAACDRQGIRKLRTPIEVKGGSRMDQNKTGGPTEVGPPDVVMQLNVEPLDDVDGFA
jgi:hypothetical protein